MRRRGAHIFAVAQQDRIRPNLVGPGHTSSRWGETERGAIGFATALMVLGLGAGASAAEKGRLVIADVGLVSMVPGEASRRATVAVQDGVITRIAGPDEQVWLRGDALIRGQGLWLMPGLIDGRVLTHDPADLHAMVLMGITSVVLADDPAGAAWLEPLRLVDSAGLPNLLRLPDGPAAQAPLGLARITAPQRWRRSDDPQRWLEIVDPQVASHWMALPADEVAELPSPRLDRQELLARIPSSSAGDPFMPPDRALLDELHAMVALGCTPTECLHAATRGAADLLGQPARGRVEVGAMADLLLLEADPRVDLAALRRIRAVVIGGRVIRAAERESTLDLLRELRGDQRRWLEATSPTESGAAPPKGSSAPPWSRRWLIRFNGFPRGGRQALVSAGTSSGADAGEEVVERRVLWSPFRSTLEVVERCDAIGGIKSLEIAFEAPAGNVAAAMCRAGVGSCPGWTLAIRDPALPSDQPELTITLPDLPGGPLLVADLWPSTVDLAGPRWLPTEPREAWELLFGFGPVSLRTSRLTLEPWRGVDLGQRIQSRWSFEALARSVAGSPWRPARVFVMTMEDAPGCVRPDSPPWPEGWPWAAPSRMVGAIGVDVEGRPLVGRFAVPEGIWEFHPVRGDDERPRPSPSHPRSTTSGTPEPRPAEPTGPEPAAVEPRPVEPLPSSQTR